MYHTVYDVQQIWWVFSNLVLEWGKETKKKETYGEKEATQVKKRKGDVEEAVEDHAEEHDLGEGGDFAKKGHKKTKVSNEWLYVLYDIVLYYSHC